jgi:hypothetical protein
MIHSFATVEYLMVGQVTQKHVFKQELTQNFECFFNCKWFKLGC